jgi:TonB family protein
MITLLVASAAVASPPAHPIDRASWFSAGDYPAEAIRKGLQGSVTFEVDVDPSGHPGACRVTKSSGQQLLDQATCDVVRSRARFTPALGPDGKPVVGRYSTNTIWILPDLGLPAATPIDRPSWFTGDDYPLEAMKSSLEGSVDFEVDVDVSGKPTACRVTKSSGHQILDDATCNIVMAKARFQPAESPGGKPVSGRYATQAVWRLDGPATFYSAAIVDYSVNPAHPACSIKSSDPAVQGPTCAQLVGRAGPVPEIAKRMRKVVVMYATATGDLTPYQGEPEWGDRVARLIADIYQIRATPVPTACIAVAAEGLAAGYDPCMGVPTARTISEADKKAAIRTRVEISTFGVPRASTP